MARSLFRQILLPLVAVALLSGVLVAAAAWRVLGSVHAEEGDRAFLVEASGLVAALPPDLPAFLGSRPLLSGDPGLVEVEAWARAVASASGRRLTLVGTDGTVLIDTQVPAWTLENHRGRPEVAKALAGTASTAGRPSDTLGTSLFYAAAPIMASLPGGSGPRVVGVLRISADLPGIESRVRPPRLAILLWLLAITLGVAGAGALVSSRVSRPLASLAEVSLALAQGTSPPELELGKAPREISTLAASLASMSFELERRISEAEAEGHERAAILDGMAEAVIALDGDLRIRMANPAARALFAWAPGQASPEGQSLLLATRSTDLEAAALACLGSSSTLEVELALYQGTERWFQAFVTPLKETPGPRAEGPSGGVVVVLNDITKLRRLERVRKDFVANVSHELRTPIQLIKGFTEALQEMGPEAGEKRTRFLGIMAGNASRMESLIDDLLTLARLEQEGSAWLKREDVEVGHLLVEAASAVGLKAEAKAVAIDIDCEEELRASLNGGLFVQALVNLLDNAVKFSPEGSTVSVQAWKDLSDPKAPLLRVEVRDRGLGIPARDLPRIFERFYRVDKARSRALGGTGLGLAIVRHIALAHGGKVGVESFEGEGSTFSLSLPLAGLPTEYPGPGEGAPRGEDGLV